MVWDDLQRGYEDGVAAHGYDGVFGSLPPEKRSGTKQKWTRQEVANVVQAHNEWAALYRKADNLLGLLKTWGGKPVEVSQLSQSPEFFNRLMRKGIFKRNVKLNTKVSVAEARKYATRAKKEARARQREIRNALKAQLGFFGFKGKKKQLDIV